MPQAVIRLVQENSFTLRDEGLIYGDSSCESSYESSDGSSDSSAGVFVDNLPSNAEKKLESVAVSQEVVAASVSGDKK